MEYFEIKEIQQEPCLPQTKLPAPSLLIRENIPSAKGKEIAKRQLWALPWAVFKAGSCTAPVSGGTAAGFRKHRDNRLALPPSKSDLDEMNFVSVRNAEWHLRKAKTRRSHQWPHHDITERHRGSGAANHTHWQLHSSTVHLRETKLSISNDPFPCTAGNGGANLSLRGITLWASPRPECLLLTHAPPALIHLDPKLLTVSVERNKWGIRRRNPEIQQTWN